MSVLHQDPDSTPDSPQHPCPYCLGNADGDLADLCDSHLRVRARYERGEQRRG